MDHRTLFPVALAAGILGCGNRNEGSPGPQAEIEAAVVELVMELEDKFDVTIPDEAVAPAGKTPLGLTIGDLADLVLRLRTATAAQKP